MHIGFLRINDEKMSKSLGNFVTIRDAVTRYPAEALRLHLLQTHYRSPMEFAEDRLDEAQSGLVRMYETLARVGADRSAHGGRIGGRGALLEPTSAKSLPTTSTRLRALAAMHEAVRAANRLMDAGRPAEARAVGGRLADVGGVFGLLQGEPEQVLARLEREPRGGRGDLARGDRATRSATATSARQSKDFKAADAIRGRLSDAGIDLKDHPDGTTSWSLRR